MSKRVFISFAIEDSKFRDFLVGQSRLDHSPFEFVDMSVKQPWDSEWKTRCRTRIKGCDGVIALISGNTAKAAGELWEIKCAIEEGKPIIGMYISGTQSYPIPSELNSKRVVYWSWETIKNFISRL